MIFYFTGTGNSQMVAETIAEVTGDRVVNISSVMKAEEYQFTLEQGEAVGFVMPTYYYGIPIQIPEFIALLQFSHQPDYIWTCLTCESLTAGAGGMLSQILRKNGYIPNARFACPVVNNSLVMAKQPPIKNIEVLLDRAHKRALNIGKFVADRRSGNFDDCSGFGAEYITAQYYDSYKDGRSTKYFKVMRDKCFGCGKCASECPATAIAIVDGKGKWVKDKCYYCLHCINSCPEHAIVFGQQDNSCTFMNNRVKGAL